MTRGASGRLDDPAPAWEHEEVLPGLHRLRCGLSNAYLWQPEGGGRATLVDTGPVGTFGRLRRTLTDLGVTPDRLELVVLTHFHDDHTGAAAEVVGWSGARVVAGRADAPHVRGQTPGPVPVLTAAEARLHARVTSSAVLGPFGVDRVQSWRDAERLADLEAQVACFGHGEPVRSGAAQALRSLIDAFA